MRIIGAVIVTAVLWLLSGCGSAGAPPSSPSTEADITVSSVHQCSSTKTINSTFFAFTYTYMTLSNGDALITCSVANQTSQSSNTAYYRSGLGTAAGACTVVTDVDAATGGTWTLQSPVPGTVTAAYTDVASAFNGNTSTLSTCIDY